MEAGSIVILHLTSPNEKYWGVLRSLSAPGITVHGINLSSFEDWLYAVACEQRPSLGLSTIFFPMGRVERMFLDDQVGDVESFRQRFERRVGQSVEAYLGTLDSSGAPLDGA